MKHTLELSKHPIYLLLFWCMLPCMTSAQLNFQEHDVYKPEKTVFPRKVAWVDIDNDGDHDILYAARFPSRIAFLENLDGSGAFADEKIILSDINVTDFLAIDINSDGLQDLIITYRTGNNLVIESKKNIDGSGWFGPSHQIYKGGTYLRSISKMDMDQDGDDDVIINNGSGNNHRVQWLENIGGIIDYARKETIYKSRYIINSFDLADLDGDGDIDASACGSFDEDLVIAINLDGLGTFGDPQIVSSTLNGSSIVQLGDFDGDGDEDMVVSVPYLEKVVFLEHTDGLGSFVERGELLIENSNVQSLVLHDLNNDGDVDLLYFDHDVDEIGWLKNLGGNFSFDAQLVLLKDIENPEFGLITDSHNDGGLDILVFSIIENAILILEGENTNGLFVAHPPLVSSGKGTTDLLVADINNDGFNDIVRLNKFDSRLSWFKNEGTTFSYGEERVIYKDEDSEIEVVVASDIDLDNDIDLLGLNAELGALILFENINGAFKAGEAIVEGLDYPREIDNADLDDDGDDDLVIFSSGSRALYWIENNGGINSTSTIHLIDTLATSVNKIIVSDLNTDGFLDILMNMLDYNLVCYPGTVTEPRFGTPLKISNEGQLGSELVAGDIDGDGDKDILFHKFYDNSLFWIEQFDNLDSFSLPHSIWPATYYFDNVYASLGDLDNDGDLDIVLSSMDSINWVENKDGEGDFSEKKFISTHVFGVEPIFVIDIDDDLDLDVVVASRYIEHINIIENLNYTSIQNENQVSLRPLRLFPNPVNEKLFIKDFDRYEKLEVFNSNAKLILSGRMKEFLSVEALTPGSYSLRCLDKSGGWQAEHFIKIE